VQNIFCDGLTLTRNHLADAFVQSDLQMRRIIEAFEPTKKATICNAETDTAVS